MKIHVNLSDWKGTLTKWALLNYVEGGLDDYGFYINNSVKNYIDYENKKYIQMVARVDLGSFNYTYYNNNIFGTSTITGIKKPATNNVVANITGSNYTPTYANAIWSGFDKGIAINTSGQCQMKDTDYDNATTFKNVMSGIYLYYELETPIETDLSDYL